MMYLVLSAAFLSYFSFPNFLIVDGFSPLAWGALVFLFPALEDCSAGKRLLAGAVYGLVFYGLLVRWFIPYSLIGYLLFVLILTLQPVMLAFLYGFKPMNSLWQVLYVAASWVLSEFLRAMIMAGFSWGLGYSQAGQPALIQVAAFTGAWGLSFALVAVNFLLYQFIWNKKYQCLLTALSVVGLLFLFGQVRLGLNSHRAQDNPQLDILAVQPNIDFRQKKDIAYLQPVVGQTLALSYAGLRDSEAQLVVWPETAWPADYRQNPQLFSSVITMLSNSRSALLFGTVLSEGGRHYNSGVFVADDGEMLNSYRKQVLVPFSEFLPAGRGWRYLRRWLHIQGYEFTPGKSMSVFKIGGLQAGLLICSEDTLGFLFRRYKNIGAGLVIVLLNDGWFTAPEALILHMHNSVMHAVENRLPVLRVANSGWSGFIDELGHLVGGPGSPLQQAVFGRFQVHEDRRATVCSLYGDWFCYLCAGFVIIIFIYQVFRREGRGCDIRDQ